MQQDAPIFSKPAGQKDHGPAGRIHHPLGHAAGRTGQQKQGQCGEQQHPSKAAVRPAGKRIPFLRLIPLPPFCCAGPSYAPQAPIVQPARLWYNKISKSTVQGERFYADHYTAGHCGYHATAGPGTLGGVCCLRRPRSAVGLRRGHAGGSAPCGREPDAGRCHLPDPLPWRPHLWSAGPFADSGGAGPHKAACAAGSGGPAGYLGGGAGTDRPAALSGEAAGAYAGPAAGAGCAERGLACRCAAGAVCHKAPGKKPWLPAGAAPCRQILAGAGPGAGGAGAAMEAAAERAERCRGGQNGAACAGAGRPTQGVERGIFRRYGPLPVLFAGGA